MGPQQEVLGFDLDTDKMMILLSARKIRELQELLPHTVSVTQ